MDKQFLGRKKVINAPRYCPRIDFSFLKAINDEGISVPKLDEISLKKVLDGFNFLRYSMSKSFQYFFHVPR